MGAWRAAGLTYLPEFVIDAKETSNRVVIVLFRYINYSNIAARLLRKALKPELRTEALKREESYIRFTPWKDGKAQRHLITQAETQSSS